MATRTYTIFAEPADNGKSWGAWVPDLAVYATGPTRDEAIGAAGSAARTNLALRSELGRDIPAPTTAAATLTVAD